MSHTIRYSLILLFAALLLILIGIEKSHKPERNTLDSLLAALPHGSASDARKQKTLAAACESIAGLIRSDSMKDTDEVVAAFHIETANLRTDSQKRWFTIQQQFETLLRQVKSLPEQEVLLQTAADFLEPSIFEPPTLEP